MLDRIIAAIKVKCTNNQLGCEWNGELQMMEDHQSTCKYQMVECPFDGCNEEMQRQALHKHKSICEYRVIQCDYCTESFLPNELQNHFEVCEYYPVTCSNHLCSELVPKCKIENHLLKDCLYQLIDCSFHSIGCSVKVLRKDLNQHLIECNQQHMLFLLQDSHLKNKMIEQLQNENKMIRLEAAESDHKLLTKIEALENNITSVREEVEVTNRKLNEYKEQYKNIISKLKNIEQKFQTLTCLTPDELTGLFPDTTNKKSNQINVQSEVVNGQLNLVQKVSMVTETFHLTREQEIESALKLFQISHKQYLDECSSRELSSLSGASETVKSGLALPVTYWDIFMDTLTQNSKVFNFQKMSTISELCDLLKSPQCSARSMFGTKNYFERNNCVYVRCKYSDVAGQCKEIKTTNHKILIKNHHSTIYVRDKKMKEAYLISRTREKVKLSPDDEGDHGSSVYDSLVYHKYIVNDWFLLEIMY
ncbi:TNF receptor-associated factor family protein DDB_G0290965-like [Hydractinia symbiolongicarpus]|nr:TNF receptor-associated factor family protein DDB_G0290965-like [Hydractinia symbiolongicarpus]